MPQAPVAVQWLRIAKGVIYLLQVFLIKRVPVLFTLLFGA